VSIDFKKLEGWTRSVMGDAEVARSQIRPRKAGATNKDPIS
jgi:hypothetical protein